MPDSALRETLIDITGQHVGDALRLAAAGDALNADELLELERQQSIAFRRRKLGTQAKVLFEEEKLIGGKKYLIGHTTDYVKVALEIGDGARPEGMSGARPEAKPEQLKNAGKGTCPAPGEMVMMTLEEFLTEEVLLGHESTVF